MKIKNTPKTKIQKRIPYFTVAWLDSVETLNNRTLKKLA